MWSWILPTGCERKSTDTASLRTLDYIDGRIFSLGNHDFIQIKYSGCLSSPWLQWNVVQFGTLNSSLRVLLNTQVAWKWTKYSPKLGSPDRSNHVLVVFVNDGGGSPPSWRLGQYLTHWRCAVADVKHLVTLLVYTSSIGVRLWAMSNRMAYFKLQIRFHPEEAAVTRAYRDYLCTWRHIAMC